MRKALHQISIAYKEPHEAEDHLFAMSQPVMARDLGIEAAWVCRENRVHIICTNIEGLETLTPEKLQPGQRLVWLPDNRLPAAQAA